MLAAPWLRAEFALAVFPLFILLVMAVIEFAFAFNANLAIAFASRDAAAWGPRPATAWAATSSSSSR